MMNDLKKKKKNVIHSSLKSLVVHKMSFSSNITDAVHRKIFCVFFCRFIVFAIVYLFLCFSETLRYFNEITYIL